MYGSESWARLQSHCDLDPFMGNLYEMTSLKTLRHFLPGLKEWIGDPTRRPLPPYPQLHAAKLAEFHTKFPPYRHVTASERGLEDILLYLLREVKSRLTYTVLPTRRILVGRFYLRQGV